MKIEVWCIGKTAFGYLDEGIDIYAKRLRHYTNFDWVVLPDIKNAKSLTIDQLKTAEGAIILSKLGKDEQLILLDENGKTFSSTQFAAWIAAQQLKSTKKIVFMIGGAYGFSDAVYDRATAKISLSAMTFSHQLVRVIFLEQIYRAFTILKGEPYHHE